MDEAKYTVGQILFVKGKIMNISRSVIIIILLFSYVILYAEDNKNIDILSLRGKEYVFARQKYQGQDVQNLNSNIFSLIFERSLAFRKSHHELNQLLEDAELHSESTHYAGYNSAASTWINIIKQSSINNEDKAILLTEGIIFELFTTSVNRKKGDLDLDVKIPPVSFAVYLLQIISNNKKISMTEKIRILSEVLSKYKGKESEPLISRLIYNNEKDLLLALVFSQRKEVVNAVFPSILNFPKIIQRNDKPEMERFLHEYLQGIKRKEELWRIIVAEAAKRTDIIALNAMCQSLQDNGAQVADLSAFFNINFLQRIMQNLSDAVYASQDNILIDNFTKSERKIKSHEANANNIFEPVVAHPKSTGFLQNSEED